MANTLVIGTTKGLTVLERENGGFTPRRHFLDGTVVTAVASDPACGTVYAGTATGLFQSADLGENWQELESFNGREIVYIHVDRKTHAVYVGTHPEIELTISEDHGRSWRAVNFLTKIPREIQEKWMFHPVPKYGPHVKSIGTSHGRIYLNIEEGWCYRSDDGGETWEPLLYGGLNIDAHVIAPHPSDPDVVYSTDAFGACKSADGGRSWKRLNPLEYGMRRYGGGITLNPRNPNVVLFSVGISRVLPLALKGAQSIVFRSENGGESWQQVTEGLPEDIEGRIEALVFEDGKDPKVYAMSDMGEVFEGTEEGSRWRTVASGLGNTYMYGLAVV